VTAPKVTVLGIGNLLLGDEGIGVLAVRRLAATDLADRAEFVDGGTGSFELLEYFEGRPRLVLIDAAMDGRPPGTVSHLTPRFASDFPRSLSAHDIGLRDLIETASLTGDLPRIDLITISVETPQSLTLEVSAPVERALEEVEIKVRELLGLA
jgi:hydrogenase maturation protease